MLFIGAIAQTYAQQDQGAQPEKQEQQNKPKKQQEGRPGRQEQQQDKGRQQQQSKTANQNEQRQARDQQNQEKQQQQQAKTANQNEQRQARDQQNQERGQQHQQQQARGQQPEQAQGQWARNGQKDSRGHEYSESRFGSEHHARFEQNGGRYRDGRREYSYGGYWFYAGAWPEWFYQQDVYFVMGADGRWYAVAYDNPSLMFQVDIE